MHVNFATFFNLTTLEGPILRPWKIGKCQNPCFAHFEQNWKVSESESVKIGKHQNWKGSNLNCSYWKVSETVEIGKCQRLLRLESVRNLSDWTASETALIFLGVISVSGSLDLVDLHGVGGLAGTIRDQSGDRGGTRYPQFHWQDPSLSTECSRCEKPSARFSVLGVAGSSLGRTSYPNFTNDPP